MRVALLIVVVAGCATAPEPGRTSVIGVPTVAVPEPLAIATPAPLPPPPLDTNPVPILAEASLPQPLSIPLGSAGEPLASAWPKEWVNVWLPLESWGRFNGLGKPNQLSSGNEAVFQLQTSNGVVQVKIGSHTASVGGLEYGLGFAPRLIRGLPYIHSLDAQKTFQVLLGALLPVAAKHRIIVLDPGHGGKDSGTRSIATRECEKNYALDWALRLKARLETGGWTVILTRTNDTDRSLADRIAIADRVDADLFISLHLNSGGANRELAGVETYCLTPTGMPSNLLRGSDDDPHENHPNNHFDDQNVQLASRLHRSFLQSTGAVDRGVRRARFMAVLRGQNRPAVLIEGGYLSNPAEALKVATPAYRQAMAEGVAKALCD